MALAAFCVCGHARRLQRCGGRAVHIVSTLPAIDLTRDRRPELQQTDGDRIQVSDSARAPTASSRRIEVRSREAGTNRAGNRARPNNGDEQIDRLIVCSALSTWAAPA